MTGSRTSFRSITLPHIPSDPDFYSRIQKRWENITAPYLKDHWSALFTLAFQPFPAFISKASAARGGSALGLSATDKNRFIIEINCLWREAKDDELVHGLSRRLVKELESEMKGMSKAKLTGVEEYLPDFMNDSAGDQDVTKTFRNYDKIKAMQRKHDPEGLWLRAGGFKY